MSIEGNRLVSCISKIVAFWERQGIVDNEAAEIGRSLFADGEAGRGRYRNIHG